MFTNPVSDFTHHRCSMYCQHHHWWNNHIEQSDCDIGELIILILNLKLQDGTLIRLKNFYGDIALSFNAFTTKKNLSFYISINLNLKIPCTTFLFIQRSIAYTLRLSRNISIYPRPSPSPYPILYSGMIPPFPISLFIESAIRITAGSWLSISYSATPLICVKSGLHIKTDIWYYGYLHLGSGFLHQ